MTDAGNETLALLGLENHRAIMLARNDQAHRSLYVIVKPAHPETARTAPLQNARAKLASWAKQYEKTHDWQSTKARTKRNSAAHSLKTVRDTLTELAPSGALSDHADRTRQLIDKTLSSVTDRPEGSPAPWPQTAINNAHQAQTLLGKATIHHEDDITRQTYAGLLHAALLKCKEATLALQQSHGKDVQPNEIAAQKFYDAAIAPFLEQHPDTDLSDLSDPITAEYAGLMEEYRWIQSGHEHNPPAHHPLSHGLTRENTYWLDRENGTHSLMAKGEELATISITKAPKRLLQFREDANLPNQEGLDLLASMHKAEELLTIPLGTSILTARDAAARQATLAHTVHQSLERAAEKTAQPKDHPSKEQDEDRER